jgi:acyl carrier protein
VNDIKETLRQFILEQYLPGESAANLKDDTPLRTSGVLDSMATLALVNFAEREYSIEFEAHETGIEHFDTIGSIAALVERKRAGVA